MRSALAAASVAFILLACGCHHGQNMATNVTGTMKGPAPALRAVHITHVNSADDPQGEDADDNTITTTRTYAGDWLDVRTTEDGYGTNEHGKLNSTDGKLKSKDGIVDSSGNVVGWKLVWEFTKPWSGGRFVLSADSINGGQEKSTYLIIKGGSTDKEALKN